MNNKQAIYTEYAPKPSGTYSQAIKVGNMVYLAGQIPLDTQGVELVSEDVEMQIIQVFKNLASVAEAAGGSLDNMVKLTIFLTNLASFPLVNKVMGNFFTEPYPARTTIEVSALPKGAAVEIEAILAL